MSRSHKKIPIVKDSGSKEWSKRQASKAVRRYKKVIQNGSSYKKLFESWNINDFISYYPWNVENQKDWENKYEWEKYYYRK
ncbi:hypothetical protein [Inediibacterium massiliense]|uniref:hypothetical protein n=1 Tax=Inediibacterium massiliense TaxID=1658111 RepID=UPI0006B48204|nr:hypothetical protein [Inediibacterium massiliense]